MKIERRIHITIEEELSENLVKILKDYIEQHKEELHLLRYHEKLEEAYKAICGDPSKDIEDLPYGVPYVDEWYINP